MFKSEEVGGAIYIKFNELGGDGLRVSDGGRVKRRRTKRTYAEVNRRKIQAHAKPFYIQTILISNGQSSHECRDRRKTSCAPDYII